MAYKTLYRVFRPKTFDEVSGQEHITDVLRNQIIKDCSAHAYLFYGPRGTGKTSTAKIFANALNCLDPQNGNPCLRCDVCTSVATDSFVDIVEIDAASNNSVDNIRDIRDKVALLPAAGRFKIYIIDEVHMLSQGAFNALLKTLEEPPSHAVFILATTELRKLPATILSRCQRYDFKRISEQDILARLREVAQKQGVGFEEEALVMIAQAAEGGMRDALSILDQCIAGRENLTVDIVGETVGLADSVTLAQLADAILSEDAATAMRLTLAMLAQGVDAHHVLRDVTTTLSELLVKYVSDAYRSAMILRALEVLIYAQNTLRYAAVPDAVLKSAIVRATKACTDTDEKDIAMRLHRLEQKLEQLELQPVAAQPVKPAVHAPSPASAQLEREEPAAPVRQQKSAADEDACVPQGDAKPSAPNAMPQDAAAQTAQLKRLIAARIPVLAFGAQEIRTVEVMGSKVKIHADESGRAMLEMLTMEQYQGTVREIMRETFGHDAALELSFGTQQPSASSDAQSIEDALIARFGADKVVIK